MEQVTPVDVDGGDSSALLGGYANATDETGGPSCGQRDEECSSGGNGQLRRLGALPSCCACGLACAHGADGVSRCLPAATRAMAWMRPRGSAGPFELAHPFGGFEPKAETRRIRSDVADEQRAAEGMQDLMVGPSGSIVAGQLTDAGVRIGQLPTPYGAAAGHPWADAPGETKAAQNVDARHRRQLDGAAATARRMESAAPAGGDSGAQSPAPAIVPAIPNSNAQVDLNGDCISDLVLVAMPPGEASGRSCEAVSCRFLVWMQRPKVGSPRWALAPDLNESLPVGAGQLAFSDLDSDGQMDVLFLSTDDAGSKRKRTSLHAWYGVLGAAADDPQVASALADCRSLPVPPDTLCAHRAYLTFLKREWRLPSGWEVAEPPPIAGARPPTISLADFDLNGFPDALLPLRVPAGASRDEAAPCDPGGRCVVLLYNDERLRCTGLAGAGSDALQDDHVHRDDSGVSQSDGAVEAESDVDGAGSPALRVYDSSKGYSVPYPPADDQRLFPMVKGAMGAVFFDLYDDGVWDVIAMHPSGRLSVWHRTSAGGSYFLRATSTNGACAPDALGGVPGDAGDWLDQQEVAIARAGGSSDGHKMAHRCVAQSEGGGPFGVSTREPLLHQAGVTYQFETSLPPQWSLMSASSVWSWNRRRQPRVGVQLAQGGYCPLQPPFLLVGLGLTNDYVERLMVGMPSGRVRRFDQAVLPNSRLTVIPYPLDVPGTWEMQLYLEPMQQMAVGLVCAALLLLLGAIIAVLEVVERVHDFRENKALRPALPL